MDRKKIGALLVVAAVVLGVVGMVLWARESSRVEEAQDRADFGRALAEDYGTMWDDEPEANRAPAIGVWVVGGLLFLSGVIVLSQSALETVK